MDYYAELGVARDASNRDIQRAYIRKAAKLHPDKNPEESAKGPFKRLSEAYETLSDPAKRERYDTFGCSDEEIAPAISLAQQAVLKVISGAVRNGRDVETVDLVAKARARLAKEIEVLETAISDNQGQYELISGLIQKLLKRLKKKGKGPDFIAAAMQQSVEAIQTAIVQFQSALKVNKKAWELLGDYEFAVKNSAQIGNYQFGEVDWAKFRTIYMDSIYAKTSRQTKGSETGE